MLTDIAVSHAEIIKLVHCNMLFSVAGGGILDDNSVTKFKRAGTECEIADERLRYFFQQSTTPSGRSSGDEAYLR